MLRIGRHGQLLRIDSCLLLAGGLFLVAGAGFAHLWGQIAFLVVPGIWLLWRPPNAVPNRWVNAGCAILLGWTLLQLMPGLAPDSFWRDRLAAVGLISHPSRPAIGVYSQWTGLVCVLVGMSWLFISLSVHETLDRGQRFGALAAFAVAVSVIGFVCFAMNGGGYKNPLAPQSHVFTFLPNRNHTALLCALGAVVAFALGFERIARHFWQGLGWLVAATLSFVGLLSLTSRAALLLCFLGSGLWILSSLRRHTLPKRMKLVVPFGFLLLAIFFSVGQVTASRVFSLFAEGDPGGGTVERINIYADTLRMLPDVWLSGSGWGSFRTVFPYFREDSLNIMAILHPESDWLLLLAESGVVGLLAVCLVIGGFVLAVARGDERVDRFRKIAGLCVLLACLHGLVDVPLHNPATFVITVWFAGLALPAMNGAQSVRPLGLPQVGWRIIGILFLVIAGLHLYGAVDGRPWSRDTVRATSLALLRDPEPPENQRATSLWLDAAVARFPFDWTLHSNQAVAALARGDGAAARAAFRRARAAQVDQGVVTYTEAQIWAPVPFATGPLLDAYRATFAERDIYFRDSKFKQALVESAGNPQLRSGLARISRADTALRLIFFEQARGRLVREEMALELRRDPGLLRWPEGRRALIWWRIGEVLGWSELANHFDRNPHLQEAHGVLAALAREARADWSGGGSELASTLEPPTTTDYGRNLSASQIELAHRRSPGDVALALALLRVWSEQRDWESVVELAASYQPPSGVVYPPAMHYWHARALLALGRNQQAAAPWRAYVRTLLMSGRLTDSSL